MLKILPDSFSPEAYNRAAAHPVQSWEWGNVKQSTGSEIVHIGEFDGDSLMHVYLLTIHTLPVIKKQIGYIARSLFPSKEALEFFEKYGKERGLVHITFEPNVAKENVTKEELFAHPRFEQTDQEIFARWQLLLDLTQSEEELLQNMKPKTRYNVRLAERKGVVVQEVTNEKGLADFLNLYRATCKRQGYYGRNEAHFRAIMKEMVGKGAHILVAYYNDKPLAAYLLFLFNNVLYYPYGGSSEEHRNLMAANLLMWETIRFGKNNGATLFDMWGAAAPDIDPTHAWSGFSRFKQSFGAEHVEFVGTYNLVISPFWYKIYNLAYTLRQKVLGTHGG